MTTVFPTITHIDDVLPAIVGRDEFVVGKRDGYTYVDYVYAGNDTFDCSIRRECRGLKFDLEGKLIARPFHKFFNLHEKPAEVPDMTGGIVMEKLDGSMVHAARIGQEIVFMTRAGITDQAKMALEFVYHSEIGDKILDFCDACLDAGITPIFEFTAPSNQIVVRYAEPNLTLLAARMMLSGDYVERDFLGREATHWGIPIVRTYDQSLADMDAFVAHTKALPDMEGYVVRVGQQMIKVKADAYVARHRAKAGLLWEKDVLRLVLENKVDDVVGMLSPEEGERLTDWAGTVQFGLGERGRLIEAAVETLRCEDRAEFAARVKDAFISTSPCRPWAFAIYSGRSASEVVRDYARHQTCSGSKARAFLKDLGVLPWHPVLVEGDV